MKIGEDKIQEIRDATDIVEVVSQYVTLKKRGKSFLGLCPFHHEKTPSFNVDPVRGFYHCFGCGEGGDVFSFLMKMENIGFMGALRECADKAHIDIPMTEEDHGEVQEAELLYYANDMAAEFFRKCLHETDAGKRALAYLAERGFSEAAIRAFHLGYAPNLWDGVQKAAERVSVKIEHLAKAGLVIQRQGGNGYYDRFRGRLIFPIQNISGRIVGFGGRIMKAAEGQPKYLNSPETAIYQKGQILYGLAQSKTGIRKEDRVILCEGYTDLIRLYTEGFDFCAATSGTALTDSQARILSRYTRNVVLVFDGDSAGLEAAMRGAGVLFKAGMRVHMVALPPTEDPDTYLKKHGRDAFSELIKKAVNIIDFQIARRQESNRLTSMESRLDCAQELVEVIQTIPDALERNAMIHQLAESLQLSESLLLQKMRVSKEETMIKPVIMNKARDEAERTLIRLLLVENSEWRIPIFSFITAKDFQNPILKPLIAYLEACHQNGKQPSFDQILNQFRDQEKILRLLSEWMQSLFPETADLSQLGLDCILHLKEAAIREQIQNILMKIKEAEKEKKETAPLTQEWLSLKKTYNNIREETISEWKKMVEIG